jgi:succinyl-CoA synthetase beta subunit
MAILRLLEYQAKELFDQYMIRIPKACLANNIDEARQAASKIGYPVILKSQLIVGGRGKAGAILKCKIEAELVTKFNELENKIVNGELPRGILVEEIVDVKKELYLSIFLNRSKRCYSLIVSTDGGVEIENVENKIVLDILTNGLSRQAIQNIAPKIGVTGKTALLFNDFTMKLSNLVREKEAELAEINPIGIMHDGSLIALDAKVIIDDSAMFRHPELKKYNNISDLEAQAKKSELSLVELDGNISIIGNGAGLVMSTLDMVSDAGGKAGSFIDFGGRATAQTIYEALKIISKMKRIKAILVNLFGGIVRTDLVAEAILAAYKYNIINIPVFARISGSESEKAKGMLKGTQVKLYDSSDEVVYAAVKEALQFSDEVVYAAVKELSPKRNDQ